MLIVLVWIQRDQLWGEDKANGLYHFCYSWSLLIYYPIMLHNRGTQQADLQQKESENTAKKWNTYTHRADSHSHIVSVMDRGVLEIISNILYFSIDTHTSCCIFAAMAPVSVSLCLSFSPQSSLPFLLFNSPHSYSCSSWKNQVIPA